MDLVETLKALFDVGGVVVVTFMLFIVWKRMNEITDKLVNILERLAEIELSGSGRAAEKGKPT